MNLAKGEFLSCTGMFGIGIPALAIAEAIASVSTGACSLELVTSSTKPQSRASCADSQPPIFMRSSKSLTSFLHLAEYIEAMLMSSLSRSFFCACSSWIRASVLSALRSHQRKNSVEHLCTRYIALASIEICFAPSEAIVAADAFMPTKCTDTSP